MLACAPSARRCRRSARKRWQSVRRCRRPMRRRWRSVRRWRRSVSKRWRSVRKCRRPARKCWRFARRRFGTQRQTPPICAQMLRYPTPDPGRLRADAAVLNTRPRRSARRCFDVRHQTPAGLRADVAVLSARRQRSAIRHRGTQRQTPAVCDQMSRYSTPDASGLRSDAAVLNARCPRSPVRYWRPAPVPPVPRHRGPGQRSAGKFAED